MSLSKCSQTPITCTHSPSFLDCCPEIRCFIYQHLFRQSSGEILGLSREPKHDYDQGPPDDWTADSLQRGLVYNSDIARAEPTSASFLRTCKLIYHEASPYFYGANKITLYAEDNNDIFFWLLDIGEENRRSIRDLEIEWAYGVSIQSGRQFIHDILENITNMEESQEEEVQKHRSQLVTVVKKMEQKTVSLIIRTLNLLATNQALDSLTVYFPGVDGGDIWDLPNDNLYFADEIFSNSTRNVHACIPLALSKMVGIRKLMVGYTRDIELAEDIARSVGAIELHISTTPEGHTLLLNEDEEKEWKKRGWELVGKTARKILQVESAEDTERRESRRHRNRVRLSKSPEGYSEGGRLKADMLVKKTNEGEPANRMVS